MSTPAVFLDRDGVINVNRSDYVKCWEEFTFLPGALEALRRLAQLPWPILVVTNQSAIGRGIVSPQTVAEIHERMRAAIQERGGRIDGVYVCPHHPDQGCSCRKPAPGLLYQAQAAFQIDLSRSWLLGDSASDLLAAQRVGCRPFLALTGRGQEQRPVAQACVPEFTVVPDLAAFVDRLLAEQAGTLASSSP